MGTLSEKELADYLKEKEYQNLLQGSNNDADFVDNGQGNDDPDDEDGPTPEDVVSDADWLRETGFEFLIKAFDDAEGEDDAPLKEVISTLTLAQAEAVLKRVDHVRAATIQKRKIGKRLPDVRDVFPSIKEDDFKSDGSVPASLIPGNTLSKSNLSLAEDDFDPQDIRSFTPSSKMVSDERKNIDLANAEKKNKIDQLRQSSVDEARTVFKSQPYESKNKKANWMEKNPFLRGTHKQGYKLGHTVPEGPVSASGVQVLSYNIRSSMKHLRPNSAIRRKSIMNLFFSTEEIPYEDYLSDKNDDDYGFKVLDGTETENTLPEVEIMDNPLGVTFPSDLGNEDQKKMRTLALIELTTLFDEHGLTYSRRKAAKRKLKDGGIFGVPLTTLVEEDRGNFPRCHTPVIFQRLLEEMERRTLHEEGILRKTASMQAAESLKELVDSSYRTAPQIVEEALAQASPHDLSFLSKSFIRELPEPLLTNAYLDAFLQVTALPSTLEQLKALNLLVMLLSEVHRETLKRLLEFLDRVVEKEEYNRMNVQNISVIMAPNLFPPPRNGRTIHGQDTSKKDIEQEVALATQSATVTKMLLRYRDILWMVPPPLLKQIREQNEESRARLNKEHKGLKLLQRKPKDETKPRSNSDTNVNERNGHYSLPPGSKVTPENNNKKSVVIQLECDRMKVIAVSVDTSTTVSFILEKTMEAAGGCGREKINGRSRASSLESFYYNTIPSLTNDLVPSLSLVNGHVLYEIGGNIGQRKLDPNSKICALLRNNPDAEWLVKCGV